MKLINWTLKNWHKIKTTSQVNYLKINHINYTKELKKYNKLLTWSLLLQSERAVVVYECFLRLHVVKMLKYNNKVFLITPIPVISVWAISHFMNDIGGALQCQELCFKFSLRFNPKIYKKLIKQSHSLKL